MSSPDQRRLFIIDRMVEQALLTKADVGRLIGRKPTATRDFLRKHGIKRVPSSSLSSPLYRRADIDRVTGAADETPAPDHTAPTTTGSADTRGFPALPGESEHQRFCRLYGMDEATWITKHAHDETVPYPYDES